MKSSKQQQTQTQSPEPTAIDFHGASFINEQGQEIAITENMIQKACKEFIRMWEVAHKPNTNMKTS